MTNALIGILCGVGPILLVIIIIIINNLYQQKNRIIQDIIQQHGGLVPPEDLKKLNQTNLMFINPKKFKL